MTDSDLGKLFIELKAARDKAKGALCLAKRRARQLSSHLQVVQQALDEEPGIEWEMTPSGLRFGTDNLKDGRLPTEEEVLEVLDTIRESKKTIQEYDEFVK